MAPQETVCDTSERFEVIYRSSDATHALAALRAREYPLLDRLGHVYLDYTAGNLSPISLLNRHMEFLRDHLLGNPHSSNAESVLSTAILEQARLAVLAFFN